MIAQMIGLSAAAAVLAILGALAWSRRRRRPKGGPDRVDLLLAHHDDSEHLRRAAETSRTRNEDDKEKPC